MLLCLYQRRSPPFDRRWERHLPKNLYPSRCERGNIRSMNNSFWKSNIDGLVAGHSSSGGATIMREAQGQRTTRFPTRPRNRYRGS